MKDVIIIVEGPQGAGKTTFSNYLREQMSSTDLYRLAGIKDKTESGHMKIKRKYDQLIEYMKVCEDSNLVFDRTFFSNEVYSRLGYLDYDFSDTFNELLEKLDNIKNAEIYLIVLYLENEQEYVKRIKRDKHQYQKFSLENSMNQQNEYLKLADEVKEKTKNINVIKFASDNQKQSEIKLKEIFGDLLN